MYSLSITKRLTRSVLVVALSVFSFDAQTANVYKWIDHEGRVHYSDKRPSQKADSVSRMSTKEPPKQRMFPSGSEHTHPAVKQWEEMWKNKKKLLEEKRRSAIEKKQAAKKQRTSEECKKASAVVSMLEDYSDERVYRQLRPGVTGSTLTRFEKKDELQKWRSVVKKRCAGVNTIGIRQYAPNELPFRVSDQRR